jgi:hypothetical protein
MVLIDSRPTGEGSVVALRYPNKIVCKYNGHASINTEYTYPFTSVGIVATDTGNIVVSPLLYLSAYRFKNSKSRKLDNVRHGSVFVMFAYIVFRYTAFDPQESTDVNSQTHGIMDTSQFSIYRGFQSAACVQNM